MTLVEFITKYNGKGIDYDGAFGDQCVDLMNQFLVDVCSVTNPIQVFPGATAYDIYQNANDSRFTKTDNTPTGIPQAGDIMFWKPNISGITGDAGHVAVFITGDTNNFTSFDQNWPTGSLCHEQAHNYNGVVGWLHFNQNDTQAIIDELRTARDNNWTLYQNELSKNNDLTKQITDLQTKTQDIRNAFEKQTEADANIGAELLDAQHKVNDYNTLLQTLGATDLISALKAIDSLKLPLDKIQKQHDIIVKATVPVMDQFFQNLRAGRIQNFLDWLAVGVNLLKTKLHI